MPAHEYVLILRKEKVLPFNERLIEGEPYKRQPGRKVRQLNGSLATLVCKTDGVHRHQRSVTRFSVPRVPHTSPFYHPCITPAHVIEHYLGCYTNSPAVVVDPFCGSGTTAEACFNLSMDFIGFDSTPEYARMTRKRIRHLLKGTKK